MNKRVSGTAQDFWYTLPINASRQAFWQLWTDVPNWSTWDTPLKEASLEQAFGLGARGQLVTRNGQKSGFVITECTPLASYTMTTNLPLGQLEVRRFLTQTDQQLEFTHRVRFLGLSRGLFSSLLGKGFMQELPEVMENLKALAQKL